MEMRWNWKMQEELDEVLAQELCNRVEGLHPLIAKTLLIRGVSSFDLIKEFFNPGFDRIDIGILKDENKAAERLQGAIQEDEEILLYGDYDVDGTCAVSMMYLCLKSFGAKVRYYIPDRYDEGYGVSRKGIDFAIENEIKLLITLDCGIRAVDELELASRSGMDVIICDHHLPGKDIPDVFAILNPKQADCRHGDEALCGTGVALLLIRRLAHQMNCPETWKDYLDLAAIATSCDIVPITGINRVIVAEGLKRLEAPNLRPGILALMQVGGFDEISSVSDVLFRIGPRINAAGRLDSALLAVELLTADDHELAGELAQRIEDLNLQRRELDQLAAIEAEEQMIERDPGGEFPSTVVSKSSWKKGIVGIVASRLLEKRYRPTIVFAEQDGWLTGSARSVEGFDLFEAISDCGEYLEKFGGHASAAGVTMKRENLETFITQFNLVVGKKLSGQPLQPALNLDLECDFRDWFNDKLKSFYSQLNRMRPFGPGNLSPLFLTRKCIARDVMIVGTDHLKFKAVQVGDSGREIPAIAFKMAGFYDVLAAGLPFDLAYHIGLNKWNGKQNIQLEVQGIRSHLDQN